MKDNSGFFLAELLLSLSILLIITTIFVPLLGVFFEQRDEQKLRYYANNILHEQLLHFENEKQPIKKQFVKRNNIEFVVIPQLKNDRLEVCVHYENEHKVCEFIY